MTQMKEQNKTPEKELNKMETSNLPDAEFQTVIRTLKEPSEDLNSIKKIQSEMMYTLNEMKNNLQGINSRVDEAKNQISDLEYKEPKNNQSEREEKRIQKNDDSVRSLWGNFKHTNICIKGVLERGRERARN